VKKTRKNNKKIRKLYREYLIARYRYHSKLFDPECWFLNVDFTKKDTKKGEDYEV